MSSTQALIEQVHLFPSKSVYENNLNHVGADDLALVPIVETWQSGDGKSWYRKHADGWIEQGLIARSGSGNGFGTETTLPTPFSNAQYTAVSAGTGNGNAAGLRIISESVIAVSGATKNQDTGTAFDHYVYCCGY